MAIMYRAWLSLRSPDRDSRWRMTWPLEASSRGGAGVGGEGLLGRKPTDVADLAQEGGGHDRSHAEQLDQAGVGLGNRGLDAGLHGGDALLQLVDVGHELGGQLPAVDGLGAGGHQVLASLGQQMQHPAWSSTLTWRSDERLLAATATQTASSRSLLRPWPTDSTRTRAASLAGTSSTCWPSPTSRWATARPIPWPPSTAHRRSS